MDVRLRPHQTADYQRMLAALGDPQVARYLGAAEKSVAGDPVMFEQFLARPDVRAFAIEVDGTYAGDATIEDIRPGEARGELRLRLLDPEQWGMGIGRSVTGQLLATARNLGLQHVWATTSPDNERAINLLRSMGFERDGRYDSGDTGFDTGFSFDLAFETAAQQR